MDKIAFGNFLAELRNEKKLTQEQLAEYFSVSSKTISKWECGNSMPDLETLVELAEFYNISLYELIKGKRIKNSLISRKDLRKVINKNSLTKIMIFKIVSLILLMVIFIFMFVSTIYTINNYNQVKIYEMISADNEFYVEGMLVKKYGNYYLAINSIDYDKSDEEFLDDKTKKIMYYVVHNDEVICERRFKEFDVYTTLREAMDAVEFYVSNNPFLQDINNFDLGIRYVNHDNEEINKTFKIILVKRYSNDKLSY